MILIDVYTLIETCLKIDYTDKNIRNKLAFKTINDIYNEKYGKNKDKYKGFHFAHFCSFGSEFDKLSVFISAYNGSVLHHENYY